MARDRRPWPYSVGTHGVSSVRVYSRDDSGYCQIEWYDDRGRQQRSLRTFTGEPILDNEKGRTLARDIAEAYAREMEDAASANAKRRLTGTHTLGDLLDKLHEHREGRWSDSYARDQARYKKFWLDTLGVDTQVREVNQMPLASIVDQHSEKRVEKGKKAWSKRTKQAYLRYLRDAFTFGKKLLMVDDRSDLVALDIPKPGKTRSLSYTEEETARLLAALADVDDRAWLVAEAYYQAGRRLNATRHLRRDDVRFTTFPGPEGNGPIEAAVLTYREETDKGRVTSEAVLVEPAVSKLRELLERPRVKASGLLLPHGDLDEPDKKAKPVRKETLNHILHDAEKNAKIEHVDYRAYHGIKRRFSGMTKEEREVASQQSSTSVETLRGTYDPRDDLERQAALAHALVQRREA